MDERTPEREEMREEHATCLDTLGLEHFHPPTTPRPDSPLPTSPLSRLESRTVVCLKLEIKFSAETASGTVLVAGPAFGTNGNSNPNWVRAA